MQATNTDNRQDFSINGDNNQGLLRDLSSLVGSSSASNSKSAISSFNKFYSDEKSKYVFNVPEVCILSQMSQTFLESHGEMLFGCWSDYMITVSKISWNTCLSYLSGLKSHILITYKLCNLFAGVWYTRLRNNVTHIYAENCKTTKTKMVDHAEVMKIEDLECLVKYFTIDVY